MAVAFEKHRNLAAPAPQAGRTPVYIVASPRRGTGKTFLARLLIDFYLADRRPLRAFDLNPDEPALANHAPSHTVVADISETRGQMALFDTLIADDGRTGIVDLQHLSYKAFFALAEEIAFFEEARHRGIEPVILFAADQQPASAQAYAALQERFARTILVPVQNEAITRMAKLHEKFPTYRAAFVPLHFPVLSPLLKAAAEKHDCSFADLHETPPLDIPIDVGFALRNWTKRAFLQLRELELRLLLEKLRTSLMDVV
jgi:hypothetical protein